MVFTASPFIGTLSANKLSADTDKDFNVIGHGKKPLAIGLILVLALGAGAYVNRVPLVLALAKYRAHSVAVGPTRDIPWSMGPAVAEQPADERPPNIILIVADDLGYNDISTFGGGVADGRVQTPHIDQLAAEGAIFTQS